MPAQTYVGLTETPFKVSFANHKPSFNNPNKRLITELSKLVWCLKVAGLRLLKDLLETFKTKFSLQPCLKPMYFVPVGEIFYIL